AVLNDRVVPVGNVDSAVGSHFDIDWTERRVIGLDQLRHFLGGVRCAILAQHKAAHAMAAEVIRQGVAVPVFRQMPAAQDLQTAMLGTARVETRENARRILREHVAGARQAVVDSFAKSAIRNEGLSPAIEGMSPGIAEAAQKNLKLHGVGPELPDAAGFEPPHTVRRLDVAMNVNRL